MEYNEMLDKISYIITQNKELEAKNKELEAENEKLKWLLAKKKKTHKERTEKFETRIHNQAAQLATDRIAISERNTIIRELEAENKELKENKAIPEAEDEAYILTGYGYPEIEARKAVERKIIDLLEDEKVINLSVETLNELPTVRYKAQTTIVIGNNKVKGGTE